MSSEWRKSSYSGAQSASCVEVAINGAVLVRDTTDNGKGLTLRVTPAAWTRFTTRIRANRAPS